MTTGLDRQFQIQLFIVLCGAVLVFRAAQLQLFSPSFRAKADATTIDKLTAYPSRGLVFDRRGRLIVNNNAMYDLMVTYNQIDPGMDTAKFCKLLSISPKDFQGNLKKDFHSGKFSKSVPFVFLKKIPIETYARLQESLYEFPGFFVQVRNIRGYPYHVGAHLLGYINEVDQRDIDREKAVYVPGDYIGDAGIESFYEGYLRGKKGSNYLLKDNLGRIVDKYKNGEMDSAAVSGSDMISSIDIEMQQYGEELMKNKTGSIVAIEPSTGEILCMISAPTYDPNLLTMTQNRGEILSRLLHDPLKTFFDRTVMAKYPPGSIFKSAVSLIGMQTGAIDPEGGFSCSGGYFYAGRLYKCHHSGHLNNVSDALAHSCNTYYLNKYRDILDHYGFTNSAQGLDTFNYYLKQFGFGQQLGIDYPNESPGGFPTVKYYDKLYPKNLGGWRSPTVMSCGIGQGEIQLTTLQMANLAATIANRGYWYAPHLAKEFRDGAPIPPQFRVKHPVQIAQRYFDYVVEGMAGCVNYGTAHACALPDIQICGKTGTSQNPHGDDHSVFFAFAPKVNPKIAIAVYVENAGWGASYAAPMASLMIEKYLKGSIAEDRKHIETRLVEANLIAKFLASKGIEIPLPAPRRDTTTKETIPSDVEVGGQTAKPNGK